jgi:hypothetical protein
VFESFNCYVDVRNDLHRQGIIDVLEGVSKVLSNGRYFILVVCVLSHGKDGSFKASDGADVSIDMLMAAFHSNNCSGMVNRPKVFIVNACRGTAPLPLVETDGAMDLPLPPKAAICDYLVCYSTLANYASFRFVDKGSPFVSTLCDVLEEKGDEEHLADVMTIVNNKMSSSPMDPREPVAQMPEHRSTLTKKIRLGRSRQQL